MASKRSLSASERLQDESRITSEQFALIGFAARLGTSLTNDAELTRDGDVRAEAQLLMSLLSSKPPPQSLFCEEDLGNEPPEISTQEHFLRDAFKFTCPSLSLKPSSERSSTPPPDCSHSESDSDDSMPSLQSPVTPAELFGRPLSVDDRNALRLSAEAMARNVMESFQEALLWRIQTWIYMASRSLVDKEHAIVHQLKEGLPSQEKEEQETPEEISKRAALEELLKTNEAKLILSLQQVAESLEIIDVKTSFRVLSKKVSASNDGTDERPGKKQRRDGYDVTHSMSFQAVLNLFTPAGYTEVMLQAPGTIEGTFANSAPDEETLTGVLVTVDTGILATTMERSSRIVVRSATESCIKSHSQEPRDEEQEEEQQECEETQEQLSPELVSLATPIKSTVDVTDLTGRTAAVVTPRHASPPSVYCDNLENPFPIDMDNHDVLRTVSPQPRTPDLASCLFTPRKEISVPSLVSPSPTMPLLKSRKTKSGEELFGSALPNLSPRKRPSLPALVEVACAAMRHN